MNSKIKKFFFIILIIIKTNLSFEINFQIIERIINIKVYNTTYAKPYFNYEKEKVVLINTLLLKKSKEEKIKDNNYNYFGLTKLSRKLNQRYNSTFSYLNDPFLKKKKIIMKDSQIKKYEKFLELDLFKIKMKISENFFVENYETLFNTYFFLDKTKKKILFKKIQKFCDKILRLRIGSVKGCAFEFKDIKGKKKKIHNMIVNFKNSKKINFKTDFLKSFKDQYSLINESIFSLKDILDKNLKKNNLNKIDKNKFLKKIELFFYYLSIRKFKSSKKFLISFKNFIIKRNHFITKKKTKFSWLNFSFKLFTIINLIIYGILKIFNTIKQKKFVQIKKTLT